MSLILGVTLAPFLGGFLFSTLEPLYLSADRYGGPAPLHDRVLEALAPSYLLFSYAALLPIAVPYSLIMT